MLVLLLVLLPIRGYVRFELSPSRKLLRPFLATFPPFLAHRLIVIVVSSTLVVAIVTYRIIIVHPGKEMLAFR